MTKVDGNLEQIVNNATDIDMLRVRLNICLAEAQNNGEGNPRLAIINDHCACLEIAQNNL